MGYKLNIAEAERLLEVLSEKYDIYAPKRFLNQGRYSDTDIVRYSKINTLSEIEFNQKSDYSAKEVITPINETLFYFLEEEFKESTLSNRSILIFARPCDINAIEIQSKIYEDNGGYKDSFFSRVKKITKFILMDCAGGDDTCFCVSMESNKTDNWSIAIKKDNDKILLNVKDASFESYFDGFKQTDYSPVFVQKNELELKLPKIENEDVLSKIKEHNFWNEYDKRCISCGACTIACPTCTCFTTKDIIYSENPKVGERKRVYASCQIEGFDQMAGQKEIRNKPSERMRYKILHKFHDYKERFKTRDMCVGCGRCILRCPEAISIVSTLEKMNNAIDEINNKETQE